MYDLLYRDQHNLKISWRKDLVLTWIDNKKAYDNILQTSIIECLKMCDKIISFVANAVKNWKVELTAKGQTLAQVKIIIMSHLPGRLIIATAICDTTQLYI